MIIHRPLTVDAIFFRIFPNTFFLKDEDMVSNHLFSIGEVAKAVGITRKTILNYESKGLILPDKKEGATANRYYTIDTFTRVRTIRMLQELGLSLNEIKEYFSDVSDLIPMIRRLEKKRDALNDTIEKLRERADKQSEAVKEITLDSQTVYCRVYHATSVADKTELLRNTALEAMKAYGTDTTRRLYFTESSPEDPQTVSCFAAVPAGSKGDCVVITPGAKALSVIHHGAYENLPETRAKLLDYAEKHGIPLSGRFRHVFWEGPPMHKDASRFVTQVIAMIE